MLSGSGAAQTFLLQSLPGDRPQLGLRFLRPDFAEAGHFSALSGVKDKDYRETELLGHYGILGGYQISGLAFTTELAGLVNLIEGSEDIFTHSILRGVQLTNKRFRPGFCYQKYLDEDFREFVNGVLGVKFDFMF